MSPATALALERRAARVGISVSVSIDGPGVSRLTVTKRPGLELRYLSLSDSPLLRTTKTAPGGALESLAIEFESLAEPLIVQ